MLYSHKSIAGYIISIWEPKFKLDNYCEEHKGQIRQINDLESTGYVHIPKFYIYFCLLLCWLLKSQVYVMTLLSFSINIFWHVTGAETQV